MLTEFITMIVTLRGVIYYPNNHGKPDRHNNVERAIIYGVQNGDVVTINVTAHNLARSEQKYSLVATGCFGGVANQLYANGECSVFECDNSKSKRKAIILSAILVPLGVILAGIIAKKINDKKQASDSDENVKHISMSSKKEIIEEGISVMDENNAGESHKSGRKDGSHGGSNTENYA